MFTGIVEIVGKIYDIQHSTFTIHTPSVFNDLKIGDSIAVNGVCLTITHLADHYFTVTAVPETLRVTNLYGLATNHWVNIERALTFNNRIGGHLVQGHVDGTGEILELKKEAIAWLVKISIPSHLSNNIIDKGFITIDGMSITIIKAALDWFTVTFIPHTQMTTIMQHYQVGTKVNLEVDMVGKYIKKYIGNLRYATLS